MNIFGERSESIDRRESQTDKRWRYGFYGLAAAFLAAFAVVVLVQNGASFLLLIAAGLCLVASRLPDITKFKLTAGGLETELRDALEEAQATVKQVQYLAAENAKLALFLIQADGRWGGGSPKHKDEMRSAVLGSLRTLGLSEAEVSRVLDIERPYIRFDHAHLVTRRLSPPRDQLNEWNAFFDESHQGVGNERSPEELRDFLQSLGLIDQTVDDLLQDYAFYEATGQIRRPEVWADRHKG
jgi:hypothetical protein